MKKKISILLACAMLFSICTVNGFALGSDGSNKTYEELPITPEEGQEILSEFSAEISYVEENYGLFVNTLDRETFETLKRIAIENLNNEDYDFSGLIDAVVITCEQNRLQNDSTTVNDDGSAARSYITTKTVRGFGPLCGQHYPPVPVGVTQTDSWESKVIISAGTKVGAEGILPNGTSVSGEVAATLTVEYSRSLSRTVEGPTENTRLHNGMYATDRIYYEILYGSVVEVTYEYPMTGLIKTEYKIASDSVQLIPKSILASTGSTAYADNIQRTKTFTFDGGQFELFDKIRYYPESFL